MNMSRFFSVNMRKIFSPGFERLWPNHKYLNFDVTRCTRSKTTVVEERVVITDDGSTIVCWHPEKQFPYEFSRPLPTEDVKPSNSVLKVENKSEIYKIFKSEDPETSREQLMKLTFTTKHRWFPNNKRYKKTFKRIKSDREWL